MGHYASEMGDPEQRSYGFRQKIIGWRTMDSAPQDCFVLVYCAEDNSRWVAKWQGLRWHGVDEYGLTREGHSAGDPEVVTGWAVNAWMPIPDPPTVIGAGQTAQVRE